MLEFINSKTFLPFSNYKIFELLLATLKKNSGKRLRES